LSQANDGVTLLSSVSLADRLENPAAYVQAHAFSSPPVLHLGVSGRFFIELLELLLGDPCNRVKRSGISSFSGTVLTIDAVSEAAQARQPSQQVFCWYSPTSTPMVP